MLALLSACSKFDREFAVNSAEGKVVVSGDGTAVATEIFKVAVINKSNFGGIYVDTPQRFTDTTGEFHWRDFGLLGARRDGLDDHYFMENTLEGRSIYIGRKHCKRCHSDLPLGIRTFEISYQLGRLVREEGAHQILILPAYMASIHGKSAAKTITLELPAGGTIRPLPQTVSAAYKVTTNADGEVVIQIAPGRADRSPPDIEIEYPRHTFPAATSTTLVRWWLLDHILIVLGLSGPLITCCFAAIRLYAQYRPIAPAPIIDGKLANSISPALAAYVYLDWERPAAKAGFMASVCGLAIQKKLRISSLRDDATVSGWSGNITGGEPKAGRPKRKTLSKSSRLVFERLSEHLPAHSKRPIIDIFYGLGDEMEKVALEEYRDRRGEGTKGHVLTAMLVLALGCYLAYLSGLVMFSGALCLLFLLPFMLVSWIVHPERRPKSTGHLDEIKTAFSMIVGVPVFFIAASYYVSSNMITGEQVPYLIAVLLAVVGFILVLAMLRMPTRSQRQIRVDLPVLRSYLLGEVEGPTMSIETYERYLPFAVALYVEQRWTEQFNHWRENEKMPAYAPDWMQRAPDPQQPAEVSL